jgi:hypothetical protein
MAVRGKAKKVEHTATTNSANRVLSDEYAALLKRAKREVGNARGSRRWLLEGTIRTLENIGNPHIEDQFIRAAYLKMSEVLSKPSKPNRLGRGKGQ